MSGQTDYPYDVFISYSHADREWVWDVLLPRLEEAGLKVIIDDRDFEPGAPLVTEKERAALQSRKTLLVLSPAYVDSEWAEFVNILVQTLDPAARKRRLIPVLRVPCRLNLRILRIRPLVSVNLTTHSDVQWQRLLNTLDPDRPATANPIQNLALAMTKFTASLPAPGWHPLGSAWLAAGLLGVVLLVGFVYLILYDWPALRETASVMVGALVFVLGLLGWREDRDFFQRLSHLLGQARPGQASMAAVLAVSLVLWGLVGRPKLLDVVCGPLGCKAAGVKRLAIGEFQNLTPNATEFGLLWTEGTRDALIQKLSQVPSLQLVNEASPQVTEKVKRELDFWIEGQFQRVDRAELRSRLSRRGGEYLSPDVRVVGEPGETLANITALQNALALALLPRLGVEADHALAATIGSTPTDNLEALALNNEGVDLARKKDYAAAEAKFRAALAMDPDYSIAHANLGFVLASQGQYDAAIASYQAAIERLPRYAVFHYNLGNLYALLDQTDEALLSLQEAIRLDPGYVQAHNELGNVFIRLEKWSDARRELEQGLRLDPSFAPLHKNLGRVALAQGESNEAIESLQRALLLYTEKPLEAIYWLAEAYATIDKEAEACQHIATFWALDPHRISEWAPDAADLSARLGCQ